MSGGSNGVNVTVKAGPQTFQIVSEGDEGYAQINHYHTHMYGDSRNVHLTKCIYTQPVSHVETVIGRIQGWYNNSDAMTDYSILLIILA